MEALGQCADNIAAYLAVGAAALYLIGTLIYFALRRSLISLCYGCVGAGFVYAGTIWVTPHLVILWAVGTFGMGTVICDGFW
ncbi:hypothetical protein JQV27_13650 [Sulfitobacter mediterraneus]|uniref:hypothetical protein n=1 Tax=Sulfitobacter mediterraneus TaxID=83219 RepID=UPI00193234D0|nr:hypothetical protein [Sulfitobacter mediterraneus]MBM1633806.1 hypothetical protein [Sulfitobacter mediterraneus]MBM1641679.1 hypothetical protein [Sulfitobacter mediterraneus]MBM1645670.1 hypothetical protein [Sulfitobacter mediterraneus]MBM1649798.1 hypothetical protein [Sulfitobacter mediterraneus]MBM1653739.1 hypothetical protein [Sulfitobacter mediterraneus]